MTQLLQGSFQSPSLVARVTAAKRLSSLHVTFECQKLGVLQHAAASLLLHAVTSWTVLQSVVAYSSRKHSLALVYL